MTELDEEIKEINELYGTNISLEDIPLDDKKTWDAFCKFDTKGVFQFSSPVAKPVLVQLRPRNIEELAAANSFIRPGTSGLDLYVKGKFKGGEQVYFKDERIDSILRPTYGAIVFQEQIMGLIAELMGISFGKADIYRRALEKMHKPKNKKTVDYFNDNVVNIATERGFDPKVAEAVRKLIIDNSGYAFNKSHAVCYSLISYYTCWMKVNYPLIFHKTMLNGNMDNFGEFMDLAKEDDMKILSPDVNYSQFKTIIENEEDKSLRIGFNIIKGVGEKAVDLIIENRPYNSINDFFEKNSSKAKNKKVVEALINSGAFDNLPILVDENIFNEKTLTELDLNAKDNKVVLNRKQLSKWYEYYLEYSGKKTIPNYEVNIARIKQKYIELYNIEPEKKSSIVVIPEPILNLLELNVDDGIKTRKKPKGTIKELLENKAILLDPFTKPFAKHGTLIGSIKINILELYLEECNINDFSFLPHPLQKYADRLTSYKNSEDGRTLIEAGIITGMIERKTKTNKTYYWLFLKTPKEVIRITLWQSDYKKYKDIIKQYGLIKVKGIKGFGGMSCEEMAKISKIE